MLLEIRLFALSSKTLTSAIFHAVTVKFHGERKNNNKDVFLFGYSAGNDYLCSGFSVKATNDILIIR